MEKTESKTQALVDIRAEDFATMYTHDFTKAKATSAGEQLVNDLFERGEIEPIRVLSNLVRLKQVVDSAEKTFRERIPITSAESYNGVTFTPKNGAEKLNYNEDIVYSELEQKLKARAELVKLATKSKDTIFDSDGCEVPKVSVSFNKPSIVISF